MSTPRTPDKDPEPPASTIERRAPLIRRAADALWLGYAVLGGIAVLTLLVVVVVDVLLRYLANTGISGGNDLVSSWFMTTIAFTGIALAQRRNGRIQVDFVMDAAPARLRLVVDVLILLLVGAVGALFAWFGWQEALDQMEAGEFTPIGGRPIWPFRFLVPIGFLGFTAACLLSAVATVKHGPTESPASEVEQELADLRALDQRQPPTTHTRSTQ